MKTYKKFLTVIIAIIFVVSSVVTVSANEHNYIEFDNRQRMDSDGSFTFEAQYSVKSDYFKPTSTSITISTLAYIYKQGTDSIILDTAYTYTVTLYKYGSSIPVGSYMGYADGNTDKKTFTGLDTSKKYYFYILPHDQLLSDHGEWLTGRGTVSPVSVVS